MSFLVGPLIPLFWTSGDVCPGFQSQSGVACTLSCLCTILRFTSGTTPAGLLAAGIVAHRIPYMLSFRFTEVGCWGLNGGSPNQRTDVLQTHSANATGQTSFFLTFDTYADIHMNKADNVNVSLHIFKWFKCQVECHICSLIGDQTIHEPLAMTGQ